MNSVEPGSGKVVDLKDWIAKRKIASMRTAKDWYESFSKKFHELKLETNFALLLCKQKTCWEAYADDARKIRDFIKPHYCEAFGIQIFLQGEEDYEVLTIRFSAECKDLIFPLLRQEFGPIALCER